MTISDERLAEMVGAGVPCVPAQPGEIAAVVQELRALRSKPVNEVEVKPMGWDGNTGSAGTAFRYTVAEPDRTIGWRVWISIGDQAPSFFLTAKPENREAAVSFAEADYRQRILSTLSLPAQEPVAYRVRMDRPFGGVWQLRHVLHDWEKWDIVVPLYASPQPEAVIEDRLPTREEAAAAAAILLRCNGYDLDVWTDGDFPDDDAWLKTLAALKEA